VVMAGLRIAVVSSISLASISQLIGVYSLGWFFTDGEQRAYPTEIYAGLVLTILLALLCDLILVAIRRLLTPWARDQRIGRSAAAAFAPPLAGAR
jgi:osmoprotectant transport system permease protein